jgi:amidase
MDLLVPDWQSTRKTGTATVAYYSAPCEDGIAELVRQAASPCFEICEAELSDFEAAMDAGMKIIARETWDAVGHLTETGLVGADVHDRLLKSKTVSDMQIAEAEDIRKVFTAQVDRVLETVDAILLPAMPCLPPSLLEASDSQAAIPITTNCRPFNLSGHPAIVLPIGEIDGRPVSMQLVGRRGEDEALCALARNVTPFQKGERS